MHACAGRAKKFSACGALVVRTEQNAPVAKGGTLGYGDHLYLDHDAKYPPSPRKLPG